MRAVTLAVLFMIVAAACLPPAGTLFETTITQPDGSSPEPVVLGDQTGLVAAIESATGDTADGFELIARPDPHDANAVIVTWVGGACEDELAMSFYRSGEAFRLHVDVRGGPGIGGGCPAIALIRGLRIQFSEPVPAGSIMVSRTR
jgi:hypothetical protein